MNVVGQTNIGIKYEPARPANMPTIMVKPAIMAAISAFSGLPTAFGAYIKHSELK